MTKMQLSFLAALAACQSLALRPELARASITRQIASVGGLLASVSSGSSSLAALEAATDIVNSMLVETGNATDHITDADEQLLEDIIVLVENTIYDSMEHSHEADKTSLADAVDAFTGCNDDIADSQSETGELGRLRAGAMDAQKELDRARELVDDWTDTNTSRWNAFDTHMRFIQDPPECPEFPQKTMLALDVYFEDSEYSRWYSTHQGAYHASRNAFTEADSALSDAIEKYDIQLAVRDAKYCDWKSVLETACIHFDACSSGAADHFSDLSVRVEHDEKQRIEAYTAGQTLIHQIRFLLAQVPDQTTPPIDTSAWTIAFPVLPEKGLCDEEPLEDDMWVPKPSCEVVATTFAGTYEVWYQGSKRINNMVIGCDNEVSGNGGSDRLHFDSVSTVCDMPEDASATMYILTLHGPNKHECLSKDGVNIVGNHYVSPGNWWGLVKYVLTQTTNCQVGAYAGRYKIFYEGSQRIGADGIGHEMVISCDNEVSGYGGNDRLHFDNVNTVCDQTRDADATMYILGRHGVHKHECLSTDGANLVGDHYFTKGNFWGTVKYVLIAAARCQGSD